MALAIQGVGAVSVASALLDECFQTTFGSPVQLVAKKISLVKEKMVNWATDMFVGPTDQFYTIRRDQRAPNHVEWIQAECPPQILINAKPIPVAWGLIKEKTDVLKGQMAVPFLRLPVRPMARAYPRVIPWASNNGLPWWVYMLLGAGGAEILQKRAEHKLQREILYELKQTRKELRRLSSQ